MSPAPSDRDPIPESIPSSETGEARPPAPFSRLALWISSLIVLVSAFGFFRMQRAVGTGFFKPMLAGLLGLALVLSGPLVALSIYFGTTLFGAIWLPGLPVSVNQAVGVGVLGAWMVWIVAGKTSWPGGAYLWMLVPASFYFVANSLLGEDPEAGLQMAKYIALYEILGFVLLTSLRHPAHWTFWFWMVLLITALNSLVGFGEYLTGLDIGYVGKWRIVPMRPLRINGFSQNAIMFDYNALWALPMGMYLALEDRALWRRATAGGITLFITLMAILTLNRQTPIILVAMLATGVFLLRHRWMRPLTFVLVAGCLVMAPYVAVKMGERLTQVGYAVKDPSYGLRRDKWRILMEMAREKPLTGIGLGSFPTVWHQYIPENLWFLSNNKPSVQYPDLGYMQMLGESGIIGLTLDLLILGMGGAILLRRRRQALESGNRAVVNLCGVLAMVLMQLIFKQFIQDVFFFPRSWWLFAMIVVVSAYPDDRLAHYSPLPSRPSQAPQRAASTPATAPAAEGA